MATLYTPTIQTLKLGGIIHKSQIKKKPPASAHEKNFADKDQPSASVESTKSFKLCPRCWPPIGGCNRWKKAADDHLKGRPERRIAFLDTIFFPRIPYHVPVSEPSFEMHGNSFHPMPLTGWGMFDSDRILSETRSRVVS